MANVPDWVTDELKKSMTNRRTVSQTGYVAGGPAYLYPAAGDPFPPLGAKVILLTAGGVASLGPWPSHESGTGFLRGWVPLPTRDPAKEALIVVSEKG